MNLLPNLEKLAAKFGERLQENVPSSATPRHASGVGRMS